MRHMRKSKIANYYMLLCAFAGFRASEVQSFLGKSSWSFLKHYTRGPFDTGPWRSEVLVAIRGVALQDGALERKAIASACTCLLRHRRDELPDGERDSLGQWHPTYREAAVFAPVQLITKDFVCDAPAQAVCRHLRHCAALHGADVALTRHFLTLLKSRDIIDRLKVMKWLPAELAARVMLEAITS